MPYIKQEDRHDMDNVVIEMHEMGVEPNGKLNYVLFKYFLETVGQELSYNEVKNYCAELRATATEIERRVLGPYEDVKKKENGEVGVSRFHMNPFRPKRFD